MILGLLNITHLLLGVSAWLASLLLACRPASRELPFRYRRNSACSVPCRPPNLNPDNPDYESSLPEAKEHLRIAYERLFGNFLKFAAI